MTTAPTNRSANNAIATSAPLSNNQLESLRNLEQSVESFLVSNNDINWMRSFRKAYNFRVQNGHCNIRRRFDDPYLGEWASGQRKNMQEGVFTYSNQWRATLLNKIGFNWDI